MSKLSQKSRRDAMDGPPVIDPGGGGGGGGQWRLLTVAKDGVTAHLVQGMLAEAGIDVMLDESNGSPGAFLKPFGDPMAPVRIYARQFDLESATLLLHEADHREPDPDSSPSRRLRGMWLITIATVLAAAMLSLAEVFGFAPCVIKVLCF